MESIKYMCSIYVYTRFEKRVLLLFIARNHPTRLYSTMKMFE